MDRRSGLNSRIAETSLVSAVEEVRLQSCSGFSIPVNPCTCGIHWLNAVEKTSRELQVFISRFSELGIFFLKFVLLLTGSG